MISQSSQYEKEYICATHFVNGRIMAKFAETARASWVTDSSYSRQANAVVNRPYSAHQPLTCSSKNASRPHESGNRKAYAIFCSTTVVMIYKSLATTCNTQPPRHNCKSVQLCATLTDRNCESFRNFTRSHEDFRLQLCNHTAARRVIGCKHYATTVTIFATFCKRKNMS